MKLMDLFLYNRLKSTNLILKGLSKLNYNDQLEKLFRKNFENYLIKIKMNNKKFLDNLIYKITHILNLK